MTRGKRGRLTITLRKAYQRHTNGSENGVFSHPWYRLLPQPIRERPATPHLTSKRPRDVPLIFYFVDLQRRTRQAQFSQLRFYEYRFRTESRNRALYVTYHCGWCPALTEHISYQITPLLKITHPIRQNVPTCETRKECSDH